MEAGLTYQGLVRPLTDFMNRLEELRLQAAVDPLVVSGMAWEYAVLQAHGQLMPDWLFRKYRDRIHKEWEAYEADLRDRRAGSLPPASS